jgi:hypothetical protein
MGHRAGCDRHNGPSYRLHCRERSEAIGQLQPDIPGRTPQTGPLRPAKNRGDYLTGAR